MDVSIIIVNYNTKELLVDCIESIRKSTKISYEIIVSDNNSKDGSVEMLKNEFSDVILLENSINGGFAYANNKGIEVAKGKYILLLNSDTIVLDNALDNMFLYMEKQKEIGILGPKLLNADLTDQTSVFAFPTLFKEIVSFLGLKKLLANKLFKKLMLNIPSKLLPNSIREYLKNFKVERKIEKVEVLVGAAMFIRKEAISDFGVLDEKYFMYYEEIDYCYNAFKHGWSCVFFPESEIIHLIGQSSKKYNEITFLARHESMIYYFEKNHGKVQKYIIKILLLVNMIFKSIKDFFITLFTSDKSKKGNLRIYKKTMIMILKK